MNRVWWVFLVFRPFLLAIEGTWEIDSVISLSRSVIAVCMCAIEMWVVCFTTDFTDTGPYLLLLVSRRFTFFFEFPRARGRL